MMQSGDAMDFSSRTRALKNFANGLVALLLGFTFGLSVAQTVLSSTLDELTLYYGAAARFIASAIIGVDRVEAAQIPRADRAPARDELQTISWAVSRLRTRQAPLVFDLSEYVKSVRSGALDGERRELEWQRILQSVASVRSIVTETLDVVERSQWLNVTLGAEDRLALREVVVSRGLVLDRFRSLPAPKTSDEINQLEQTNKYYRQLISSLGDLNVAVEHARERLRRD
jgi:hypothetical protein